MTENSKHRVGMISLGCPKNQVDAELMLAKLGQAGFEITNDLTQTDIVVVNTCGFIDDAKKEAIENILEMAQLKGKGSIQKIIVTGCLAERYQDEVISEIPEIDAVVGIGANADIVDICSKVMQGDTITKFPPKSEMPLQGARVLTTPSYWAYLKVADGCSNCCTYCAIPLIRGKYRSRKMEDIVEEACSLADAGVKELVVIAQDTTRYGEDIYGKLMLPELLNRLCEIEKIEWIRLLYLYPDRITDELIETIASQPKVLHYIDLPLQHADEKILSAMNRTGSYDELKKLIVKIRTRIPDMVLRTTFITGFPGEGDEEFTHLAEFVKEIEFDRLGCFAYSPEEGTPAASMPNQLNEDVKKHRGELIMESQYGIFIKKNKQKIGKIYKVLVEGYHEEDDCYFGRSYMDSPEIDSQILFTSKDELEEGEFVNVKIVDVADYDLIGETVN